MKTFTNFTENWQIYLRERQIFPPMWIPHQKLQLPLGDHQITFLLYFTSPLLSVKLNSINFSHQRSQKPFMNGLLFCRLTFT